MAKTFDNADWIRKLEKYNANREKLPICDAGMFTKGGEYHATNMGGHDSRLVYKCIFVGEELVAFVFQYQGRERIHHAYYKDIKWGDFVKAIGSKE